MVMLSLCQMRIQAAEKWGGCGLYHSTEGFAIGGKEISGFSPSTTTRYSIQSSCELPVQLADALGQMDGLVS